MKSRKSTIPRKPSTSRESWKSRKRRIHPCRSSRPSRPAHSIYPSIRILFTQPMGHPAISIPSSLVGIVTIFRLGAPFRQVASVILVIQPIINIIVCLFRLPITDMICRLVRLSPWRPTIGYDKVDGIGRIRVHPHPVGALTGFYTQER